MGQKRKWGPQTFFLIYEYEKGEGWWGWWSITRNSGLGDFELPIPHKTSHPYRIKTFLIL